MKLAELEGVRAKPTSHMGQDTNVQINIMGLEPKIFLGNSAAGGVYGGLDPQILFSGEAL